MIPLLERDFHVLCVSYDGFDETEQTEFPSMLAETEKIEAYLKEHCGGHIRAAYGCSLGGSFVELLAATAALGQERGLPSLLVSNGFMSPGCLELLGPLVRAANIDLKAFSEDFYHHYCGARLRPVLDNLVRMRALGWWLEVTTLILEGLNDGEAELRALARFIRDELGADTPWHVTAFHPAYRMTDHPATRAETLRRCRDIGLEEGLRFVYTGNVFCAGGGDTLCPQCGAPCLERQGWQVIMRTDTGVCPRCGSKLPGVWEL